MKKIISLSRSRNEDLKKSPGFPRKWKSLLLSCAIGLSTTFITLSYADPQEDNPKALELVSLWNSSIGAEVPQGKWYQDVLKFRPQLSDDPSVSGNSGKCGRGAGGGALPSRGCVVAKKTESSSQTYVMDIMSIDGSTAAVKERLAQAELFLNQLAAVQLGSVKSETSRLLARRQRSAQIEVFLGSLLRFAEADSLAARCSMLTRAEKVFGPSPEDISQADIEPGWESALEVYRQVKSTFGSVTALAADICVSRTVSTRQQIENEAKTEALSQLAAELKKVESSTRDEMQRVLEGYQVQRDKLKALYYYSPEMLELHTQVGNISSNVKLVQEDGLCATSVTNCPGAPKSLLGSISEIDLSKLEGGLKVDERPDHPLAVSGKSLRDYIEAESVGLRALLRALQNLATTGGDTTRVRLAVCNDLEKVFDKTTYTASAANDPFLLKFHSCLRSALETITEAQSARSTDRKFEQELARHLATLANAVLTP